jgi:hypothetical protein
MLRRLLALVAALAATACTITLDGEGVLVREERRFAITGAPELILFTTDGSIEVRSWNRTEVLVEVEKRGGTEEAPETLEVRASQDGNTIRIEVPRAPRSDVFGYNPSVSLRVTAPAMLTLRAQTLDGPIVAERLDGTIEVRTGDGPIRLDRVSGQVTANTGDGPITVRGRFDTFRADTGDGPMTIEVDEGSVMNDDWSLTTSDGSITVRLPRDFNAELDAQSGDGPIALDGQLRARASGSDGNDGMAVLRTRLGAGGRTLLLRSGDGPIRVVSR